MHKPWKGFSVQSQIPTVRILLDRKKSDECRRTSGPFHLFESSHPHDPDTPMIEKISFVIPPVVFLTPP